MKKYIFIFVLISLFFLFNFIFLSVVNDKNNPEEVINNLYEAIEIAESKGEYGCCIEPPCTMCYLGHWKFEKGTCYCDDAIIEGRDEDVCPECIKGIEEGFCSSAKTEKCEIS